MKTEPGTTNNINSIDSTNSTNSTNSIDNSGSPDIFEPELPQHLKLQPEEFQQVYKFYLAACASRADKTHEEICKEICDFLIKKYKFPRNAAELSSRDLVYVFSPETALLLSDAPGPGIVVDAPEAEAAAATDQQLQQSKITLHDYEHVSELFDTFKEEFDAEPLYKNLLVAFLLFYRANYHQSGWIKYDRKMIFYLAGIQKWSSARQEKATAFLHQKCGLNM